MSDTHDRGITVTPIRAMDQPIDTNPESTAAFIGRTLRGPLDTPVMVHHLGEFRRRFGDSWTRSSLGPAVRQFFEHGGRNLVIVRVANNARGALLRLPAGRSSLSLSAIEPGSSESIRCAVDYDGIDESNEELFNLTVQRLDPASGLVTDQEIFKGLSCVYGAETYVADILSSSIVRVEQPVPGVRPDRTTRDGSRFDLAWVDHEQDGTDGSELSDYDLIGSRTQATGLFALQQVEQFDVLYLPPRGRDCDPGPAAVLAAERYCRQRGAMLIVDPPNDASTTDGLLAGVCDRGFASPNILSYFPRVRMRGEPGNTARTAGGAIAGLLCKLDRTYGCWQSLNADSLGLHRSIQPCQELDDDDRRNLVRAGINVIRPGPAGRARIDGSVTLSRGSETNRAFSSLPVRRTAMRIGNAIDVATRWTVFEKPDHRLTARIRQQILGYFDRLYDAGALVDKRFLVHCDAGLARQENRLEHGITIVLGFHIAGSERPLSLSLHQTVHGCRVASAAFAPVARDCA